MAASARSAWTRQKEPSHDAFDPGIHITRLIQVFSSYPVGNNSLWGSVFALSRTHVSAAGIVRHLGSCACPGEIWPPTALHGGGTRGNGQRGGRDPIQRLSLD